MARSKVEWVVLNKAGTRDVVECLRCGRQHTIEYPVSISTFAKLAEAYEHEHRNCKANTKGNER